MTELNRRKFLSFLAVAPAIVRPGILMPIKPVWWVPHRDLYVGPGRPWATLEQAMDYIATDLNFADCDVTINIDAGVYAGCKVPPLVSSLITFKGAGSGRTIIGPGDPYAIDATEICNSIVELTDLAIAGSGSSCGQQDDAEDQRADGDRGDESQKSGHRCTAPAIMCKSGMMT